MMNRRHEVMPPYRERRWPGNGLSLRGLWRSMSLSGRERPFLAKEKSKSTLAKLLRLGYTGKEPNTADDGIGRDCNYSSAEGEEATNSQAKVPTPDETPKTDSHQTEEAIFLRVYLRIGGTTANEGFCRQASHFTAAILTYGNEKWCCMAGKDPFSGVSTVFRYTQRERIFQVTGRRHAFYWHASVTFLRRKD